MANVGYVRVSSVDQKTDRQLDGLVLDKVFEDKASAADTKRPQLEACLDFIREGDTLSVHSIDRLARNLQDLLRLIGEITGKGVSVTFHKEHLTFSGQSDPFQNLQLQIIGAVAEFERALIRERQREGIAKAKEKGKHLGRVRKLTDEQEDLLRSKAVAGEEKIKLAHEFGISRQSVYRVIGRPCTAS
jgi:DNA invertase Pin-like site-specific DNA recombinase